jgi:hypothetical protein
MKKLIYLLAGTCLFSFANPHPNEIAEGIWMGAYETDDLLEDVVLKFDDQNQAELYKGKVEDQNKLTGSYELEGDSVLIFTCKTALGEQFRITGHFNSRKNYMDGTWKTNEKQTGNFYLRKQVFREMLAQP